MKITQPKGTKMETVESKVEAKVGTEISALAENAKLADVIAKVNELVALASVKRDRGPKSLREMTDDDARRVIAGDLKGLSHGKAAEAIGLSYGQVYGARLQFTFKAISKELGAWKK
jgi:DNA-directed RNA polymerase specialized sigma24 family protein